MSLTGSKTGGRAILRLTGRSEKEMENINMGGQISSADFGQFSLGVYTKTLLADLYGLVSNASRASMKHFPYLLIDRARDLSSSTYIHVTYQCEKLVIE